MTKKVKVGILGCADIAKKAAIPSFQALANAEVISIASRNRQKAKEFAALFSIPRYESYDSLLANPEIEAVYIPLPNGLHAEWILKAIKAGKHVICEKSLTTDFRSAVKVIEAARKSGRVLFENFMCGFHPQHQKVLSLMEKGKIGKPFLFRGYFCIPPLPKNNFRYDKNLGGGSLYELGCYPVFMARKIFQGEPVSVAASLFEDKKKGINTAGAGQLKFENKKIAQIVFGFDLFYQNNYSVLGTEGLINLKRAYALPKDKKPQIELVKNDGFKERVFPIEAPAANHFELIFEDFCKTILDKKQQAQKRNRIYAEISAQAKVLEAIKLSSLEKREVLVKEIR